MFVLLSSFLKGWKYSECQRSSSARARAQPGTWRGRWWLGGGVLLGAVHLQLFAARPPKCFEAWEADARLSWHKMQLTSRSVPFQAPSMRCPDCCLSCWLPSAVPSLLRVLLLFLSCVTLLPSLSSPSVQRIKTGPISSQTNLFSVLHRVLLNTTHKLPQLFFFLLLHQNLHWKFLS